MEKIGTDFYYERDKSRQLLREYSKRLGPITNEELLPIFEEWGINALHAKELSKLEAHVVQTPKNYRISSNVVFNSETIWYSIMFEQFYVGFNLIDLCKTLITFDEPCHLYFTGNHGNCQVIWTRLSQLLRRKLTQQGYKNISKIPLKYNDSFEQDKLKVINTLTLYFKAYGNNIKRSTNKQQKSGSISI